MGQTQLCLNELLWHYNSIVQMNEPRTAHLSLSIKITTLTDDILINQNFLYYSFFRFLIIPRIHIEMI